MSAMRAEVSDMDPPDRGPKDVPTRERMATIAIAAGDAVAHEAKGERETEQGARHTGR